MQTLIGHHAALLHACQQYYQRRVLKMQMLIQFKTCLVFYNSTIFRGLFRSFWLARSCSFTFFLFFVTFYIMNVLYDDGSCSLGWGLIGSCGMAGPGGFLVVVS